MCWAKALHLLLKAYSRHKRLDFRTERHCTSLYIISNDFEVKQFPFFTLISHFKRFLINTRTITIPNILLLLLHY